MPRRWKPDPNGGTFADSDDGLFRMARLTVMGKPMYEVWRRSDGRRVGDAPTREEAAVLAEADAVRNP